MGAREGPGAGAGQPAAEAVGPLLLGFGSLRRQRLCLLQPQFPRVGLLSEGRVVYAWDLGQQTEV